MTLRMYDEDYVNSLNDLFVKFWYNTAFYQGTNGSIIIGNEDFMTLAQMCTDLERGQYEHSIGE